MTGTTNGIVPTFDLTGNNNNGGWGNMGEWIIGLVALGMLGNGGFFGGGNNNNRDIYPWLANGQQDIMNNTNNGFDTLHLSNQIEGVRDGISDIATAICSSTASLNSNISNSFYNSEIAANNRAVNQMQDTFALSRQFADCCCENRLATCQTQNIVQNEGNATRFADANNTRDIITNATANTQAILDKLCQLELDGKQSRIDELERQNLMLSLDKSQTAQNAFIAQGFANEVDQLYNRLSNCPVPSTPVYGRTPIFTCNNGCGCGGNLYGTNI